MSSLDLPQMFAKRAAVRGDAITAILSQAEAAGVVTFSGGFPATETLPAEIVSELARGLFSAPDRGALQYAPTEGLPGTRRAVAGFVSETQAVSLGPDELLVTSGGIEALQLVSRVLIDPGDLVYVEAPSYLGAIMAFAGFEARVEAVTMDSGGLSVEELSGRLSSGERPKLIYVIPDHQNPTGLTLTPERRRGLVELCRRYGVLIVEDVAYSELSFDGSREVSLYSLGPDVVLQIGTFSKIFFPGVRLGWAIGPETLLEAMTGAKQNSDQCSGALGQRLIEAFLEGGHMDGHLKEARALYADRAAAMVAGLETELSGTASWTTPRGGFFVWLKLQGRTDSSALSRRAAECGVTVVPGGPFYTDGRGTDELRLSFSRATPEEIAVGVSRLATAIAGGERD